MSEPLPSTNPILEERVARAIALCLGDRLDNAFLSKSSWNRAGGKAVDGSFRDVNAPLRSDYLEAARSAIFLALSSNDAKRSGS